MKLILKFYGHNIQIKHYNTAKGPNNLASVNAINCLIISYFGAVLFPLGLDKIIGSSNISVTNLWIVSHLPLNYIMLYNSASF